tara:strand:- start:105 stop:263 length:159 start_codon:yes stop_codon:yes gene_type:complete
MKNEINNIVDTIIDNLSESINNEIFLMFGHSIDIEKLEQLHELIYNELLKQM